MLRSLMLIAASIALLGSAQAQTQQDQTQNPEAADPAKPGTGKLKTTFGVTGPTLGHAPVNANGTPIKDRGVTTGVDGRPVTNLSGGTNVNPYTGVPVGQPMHPNDLGAPETGSR